MSSFLPGSYFVYRVRLRHRPAVIKVQQSGTQSFFLIFLTLHAIRIRTNDVRDYIFLESFPIFISAYNYTPGRYVEKAE